VKYRSKNHLRNFLHRKIQKKSEPNNKKLKKYKYADHKKSSILKKELQHVQLKLRKKNIIVN